jgi:hypothetical protein
VPKTVSRKKPATGTCVSYSVRRLGKERPDLLERVKAGDLSPHAAMVECGFREKQITVPDDPVKAARRLLLHFQGDRLETLVRLLTAEGTDFQGDRLDTLIRLLSERAGLDATRTVASKAAIRPQDATATTG